MLLVLLIFGGLCKNETNVLIEFNASVIVVVDVGFCCCSLIGNLEDDDKVVVIDGEDEEDAIGVTDIGGVIDCNCFCCLCNNSWW